MRRFLLATTACLPFAAHAAIVNNPGLFPSATMTAGNCVQATGQNSVATTSAPCGSGGGGGTIVGPVSSTIGAIAVWSNASGTGLADSNIIAANIPTLGANNTWGGINAFEVRPTFNGAVPYDTANLPAALAPYLLASTAATTYLTQAAAAATYLTPAQAAATYLTPAQAAATYATILGVQSAYMPFTGGTFTGPVTFNLAPTLTGAATAFRGLHLTTNNVLRWNVGADGAETGGNTGSDFHIYGYNDAGVFQGAAMTIARSTLTAAFLNRPTFNGAVPWDSANLNPANLVTPTNLSAALAPYLLSATAASTYLTKTDAAATYTTPAEVDAALTGFLTIANASSTYLTQSAAQQTYATIAGVQSAYLPFAGGTITGNLAIGGTLNVTGLATFAMRPMFGSAVPWDSANLAPGSLLTPTQAAATYMPLAGGTFTGGVQFNLTPTIANQALPVTDSSPDVPTTSWVQSVITSRVGNGPFMPATGSGMPYDIPWTMQGLNVPVTPIPSSTVIMQYEFVRNVTIPVAFSGSRATARATATNTTDILVQSSRYGLMGNLVFTGGATKPDGIWSITATGPFHFQAGDTLTLVTGQSPTNPGITDPTLNGISGTILGALQ